MECQSTVPSSRTIEELLVEASDRTFRQHARNLVLRVFVVRDLLVLALNVIRLNPCGTRVNVGGLLCTAEMLNGVFGEGENRHIARWRSVKFTDHWEEEEDDGTKILHDRERFSHELTLVFANGKTQILTHEKKDSE